MSGTEDVKQEESVVGNVPEETQKPMPSSEEEEAAVKKKYGGIVPKKPPLISKDHERAYFDSADWALGKQGVEKPKGPLEALRPKLQPTQQQTRYRKSLALHQMMKTEEMLRLKMQVAMSKDLLFISFCQGALIVILILMVPNKGSEDVLAQP